MGAVGGGVRQQGWEDHGGGGGRRFDDPRGGGNCQAQGLARQGAEFHCFKGKQKEEDVENRQVYPTDPIELRDRLNFVKEHRAIRDRKEDEGRKLKCFHCQEVGHHQKDCSNAPICYKCKEEGHMAAECVGVHAKARELKMFGFAIPDQWFYNIMIPRVGEVVRASCIIQVL
jgi:hypothetical protein